MTRYELLERIGVGGMAEIFRGMAVASEGFEKPVAIKRILPNLSADQRFVSMLIREANTLSQLRNRNIVQIFDVGVGADGQYFLVMEFVDGVDMAALFEAMEKRGKRLPVHLALHLCAEVCDALHFAHHARGSDDKPLGLVHRDVSPSNILVSKYGEVKLTDFGIAKRPEEATGHGGVRGKFAYISPEQAFNKKVDARSDVFSLGIVMFELITGRRLFSGMSDFDALQSVREGRVPPPRSYDPGMSDGVERLLATALSPEPAERYQTAGSFGAAIREYRYTELSTAGDPAKELARLVSLFRRDRDRPDGERTVVRLETAAGFNTGFNIPAVPAAASEFDDEKTRAMPDRELRMALGGGAPRRPESEPEPILDEATREIQIEQLLEMAPADDESTKVASVSAFRGPAPAQAGPPGGGALGSTGPTGPARLSSAFPASGAERISEAVLSRGVAEKVQRKVAAAGHADDFGDQYLPTEAVTLVGPEDARRRSLIIAVVVAALLGVASFVIAGALLSSGETPSESAADPAAAPEGEAGDGTGAGVDEPPAEGDPKDPGDSKPSVVLPVEDIETGPAGTLDDEPSSESPKPGAAAERKSKRRGKQRARKKKGGKQNRNKRRKKRR